MGSKFWKIFEKNLRGFLLKMSGFSNKKGLKLWWVLSLGIFVFVKRRIGIEVNIYINLSSSSDIPLALFQIFLLLFFQIFLVDFKRDKRKASQRLAD